jgi:hypothetical protein
MFAIEKRADVSEQLSCVYRNRLQQGRLPEGHKRVARPSRLVHRSQGRSGWFEAGRRGCRQFRVLEFPLRLCF